MPTNLYGPGDNYDLETSHVLPAMIRKFHIAKLNNHSDVVLWGTGTPKREFLHVDDLASAVVFALKTDLSLSKRNRLFAKVGAAFYDYQIDLDHSRVTDEDGTGLFLEAGWEYRWDNGFGLNASLQHQDADDLELDTFNIGISYSF